MKSVKNNNLGVLFLFEVLIVYRILCTFVPIVSAWSPTVVNMSVLGLIYLLFLQLIGYKGIMKVFEKLFPLILLYVLNNVVRSSETSLVNIILNVMRLLVWPVGIAIMFKYNCVSNAKRILFIFVICIAATMLTTYWGNLEFPGVSRAMAHLTSDGFADQVRFYQNFNIGGFDFIYTLPFLPPFAIYCFKMFSKKWLKLLAIVFVFILAITVYEAHYTTALVTSLMSVLLFLLPHKISMTRLIGYYIVMAFLVFLCSSTISVFLSEASSATEAGVYAERFQNMSDMMTGTDIGEGNTANRISLYQDSFFAFVDNPIVGGKAGGHSMILDMMARCGIFGLVILILGFSNLYKHYVSHYKNHDMYPFCIYLFALQLMLATLNPVFGLEIFLLVIPLFELAFNVNNKHLNIYGVHK